MLNAIIEFTLKHRLNAFILAFIVLAAGYFSYQKLPINAFPDVSPNLVQVFTETDGLAPEEIEQYVTFPVESVMNGLPGVKNIRSVSNFGLSVVNVYFEDDMDIYFCRQIVGERLTEARGKIPAGFGEPNMGPISTGMGLVLFYYLEDETGERSLTELRSIQDWLIKIHLQTVPGVTEILGIGGHEKQFHVNINPDALLRYDVTMQDVIEKIEANNLNVGAQFIEKNAEEFIVRSLGLAKGIDDLKQIVIKNKDGTPVYLSQVANIEIGGAIRRGLETMNGTTEVVAGMVIKLFGTNSSSVIASVEEKMDKINKILPPGIKLIPYYEQKTLVEACVATVVNALLQGIILVALLLMVFMGGIRPSIVVALSIPFSVMFAIVGMYLFGISANLMSFGGLAIAIGMMVDGTIVVVENVERHLKDTNCASKLDLIKRACLEVGRPIAFAIFIIILVFIPLFTLQGVEGKMFRPLAYTVSLSMLGSLVFAVFIAPVLTFYIMKFRGNKPNKTNLSDKIVDMINMPFLPIVTLFINKRYLAIFMSIAIICTGIYIFPKLGSEFTPTLQEGSMVVRLAMAPSIALSESKRITMLVEKRLMKIPEITRVVSRIGRGEVGAHADPVNSAEMFISLKPREKWRINDQEKLKNLIHKELGEIPGVLVNFTQPIAMTIDELLEGVRAELAIKLFGDDLDVLKSTADEIAEIIGEVKGAADVQADQISGMPQLQIKVNRSAIARYGLNVSDVQNVIETAIGGANAGEILEGVKRFGIIVRLDEDYRSDMEAISKIIIPTSSGAKVPLSQLVELKEVVGPRQITREKNQRFISIQCNVNDRDIGSFVADANAAIEANVKLPPGYLITWGGQFRLQQQANARLMLVIPITLLLIAFMLYINFSSVKNSLLLLFNIPLALVGGIVALWVTDQNLSVPSSVGFIALFGIALENGMVLVSYFNELVKEGMPMNKACITGASLRLRPVLMTALTTGLGLLPLLYSDGTGSEVQRPLATVVLGGLVTSTILTLLVIPAIYKWFADKNQSQPIESTL